SERTRAALSWFQWYVLRTCSMCSVVSAILKKPSTTPRRAIRIASPRAARIPTSDRWLEEVKRQYVVERSVVVRQCHHVADFNVHLGEAGARVLDILGVEVHTGVVEEARQAVTVEEPVVVSRAARELQDFDRGGFPVVQRVGPR